MRAPRIDVTAATWRKSSYSNPDGGNCVEIADALSGSVPVRDSKTPDGPALIFEPAAWSSFVHSAKTGRFGSCAVPGLQGRL